MLVDPPPIPSGLVVWMREEEGKEGALDWSNVSAKVNRSPPSPTTTPPPPTTTTTTNSVTPSLFLPPPSREPCWHGRKGEKEGRDRCPPYSCQRALSVAGKRPFSAKRVPRRRRRRRRKPHGFGGEGGGKGVRDLESAAVALDRKAGGLKPRRRKESFLGQLLRCSIVWRCRSVA